MGLTAFQVAATGTAQNLANNPVLNSVTITAKSTNTANIAIGSSATVSQSTGFLLEKGQSITVPLRSGNTNEIWIEGTAADIISVIEA